MAETKPVREQLGARLRQARIASGLSEAALAEKAAVPEGQLKTFETGGGGLSTGALVRLARVLRIGEEVLVDVAVPFDIARVPHTLLKTASVTGFGALSARDEEILAAALVRANDLATIREFRNKPSLLERFLPSPAPARDAHKAGYRDAIEVRAILDREGALRGLRRLIEDRFGILVVELDFEDWEVVGAACRLESARGIAVRKSLPTETWRRFVLGHELAHHLRDLEVAAGEVSTFAIANKFDMEPPAAEKRANAFAAMLLAPEEAVRMKLGPPAGHKRVEFDKAREWAEAVCSTFAIGFSATAWHLHNLAYYDEGTAKLLLDFADPTPPVGFEEDTRWDGLSREVFEALAAGEISIGRARNMIGDDVEAWVESMSTNA